MNEKDRYKNYPLRLAYRRLFMNTRRLKELEASGQGTALEHARLLALIERQTIEYTTLKAGNQN